MIKLLFPTFVLTKQYLDRDKCSEITPEYMVALKEEIDAMRKRDPKGRNTVSYTHLTLPTILLV